MNWSDLSVASIATLSQLAVAVYAIRLNRIFGIRRVGWSLFTAFALLAVSHFIAAIQLFSSGSQLGITIEVMYAFIWFLLLIGLTNV